MIGIEKLLYSVGGSIITLVITGIVKLYEKQQNIKKQTKILIQFIDNIIIKYLKVSQEEYGKILEDIDDDKLFDSRVMTKSPMLNKQIFDFFEKKDLMKMFNYCQDNSVVDLYHNFHEIDFLQQYSPYVLLKKYTTEILDHFDGNECKTDTFETRQNCIFYQQKKEIFIREVEMQRSHTENLIKSFNQIKFELLNIEELNEDE